MKDNSRMICQIEVSTMRSMHLKLAEANAPEACRQHEHTEDMPRKFYSMKWLNTEAGMLPGKPWERNAHSRFSWFTEFCKSQCLSHFAALFLEMWAETSLAEGCKQRNDTDKNKTEGSVRSNAFEQSNACPTLHWCAQQSHAESSAMISHRKKAQW